MSTPTTTRILEIGDLVRERQGKTLLWRVTLIGATSVTLFRHGPKRKYQTSESMQGIETHYRYAGHVSESTAGELKLLGVSLEATP